VRVAVRTLVRHEVLRADREVVVRVVDRRGEELVQPRGEVRLGAVLELVDQKGARRVPREDDREPVPVVEPRGLSLEGRSEVDEAEPALCLHGDDRRRRVGQ
jgi:hypothetical protein